MRLSMMLFAALALCACGNKDSAPKDKAPAAKKGPSAAPAQKAKLVKKAKPKVAAGPAGSQPVKAAGSQPVKAAGSQPANPHKAAGSQPANPHKAAGSQPAKAGSQPANPHAGSQPGAGAAGTAQVSGALAGTIKLADNLKGDVKPGAVIFIIVRRDEGEGKRGMMIAAKKLPVPDAKIFPLKYIVTGRDVMMAGTKLFGPVRVEARIDHDGDALSKNPGDIVGGPIAVPTGAKNADFTLSQKL
jgi:hypothetical protein